MWQSIGYLGASLCPFAVSLMRGGQGPFAGPALMIVAITILCTWCGLKAAPQVVLPHLREGQPSA